MTEEEDNKQVTTNSEMGVVYPLDVVVVNIANTQATRYLRSGISFEVADESILEELEKRKPQITDMIIMILSNKELDELSDFAGKNQIRKEIKEKVNSKLIAGKIKNVYFTEFVIQ
jgi:flagellar FliL protein